MGWTATTPDEGISLPSSGTCSHKDHHSAETKLFRCTTVLCGLLICLCWLISTACTPGQQWSSLRRTMQVTVARGTTAFKSSLLHIGLCHMVNGPGYELFSPAHEAGAVDVAVVPLLSGPEVWIPALQDRFQELDALTEAQTGTSVLNRARAAYLELLAGYVSAKSFGNQELSVTPATHVAKNKVGPMDPAIRESGADWTYLGDTMTGSKRLQNVKEVLENVFSGGIAGDYIETGVWRGGSSIYARGVIRAYDEGHRRSFVCDSFQGLPPGDRHLDDGDASWDSTPYLEVSAGSVTKRFQQAGVLDANVIFVKGFFNDTMRHVAEHVRQLAVMRLDGDMYESTVDVLYRLYGKLSVGGYVIMDDWFGFPSKTACEDFFDVHAISPIIVPIDGLSAYWRKTEEVKIQMWRYEQSNFKP